MINDLPACQFSVDIKAVSFESHTIRYLQRDRLPRATIYLDIVGSLCHGIENLSHQHI